MDDDIDDPFLALLGEPLVPIPGDLLSMEVARLANEHRAVMLECSALLSEDGAANVHALRIRELQAKSDTLRAAIGRMRLVVFHPPKQDQ